MFRSPADYLLRRRIGRDCAPPPASGAVADTGSHATGTAKAPVQITLDYRVVDEPAAYD
ncbi:MAG: hypothetical protein HY232_09110 [Acidobacteria bacterium]|nr:hypothetical protein [Acidobacteriota bacterium]